MDVRKPGFRAVFFFNDIDNGTHYRRKTFAVRTRIGCYGQAQGEMPVEWRADLGDIAFIDGGGSL